METELNNFHDSIKFTYELEKDKKISFLDVLITRTEEEGIETSVYRKPTNTDIYINWNAHAPPIWKIATLKSLIKRAFLISSTRIALDSELAHIQRVFCDLNDYPPKLVETIVKNETSNHRIQQADGALRGSLDDTEDSTDSNAEEEQPAAVTLHLPYAGAEGAAIVSKLQKSILNTVNKTQKKVKVGTVYKATRLGSRFNLKDKIVVENQHNLTYHGSCPNKNVFPAMWVKRSSD